MTIRDVFIDAMSTVDDELLTEHIRRKNPTKVQRMHKYIMACAIYAAACLIIAVALPFIIGHGDDPAPVPGEDPIVVETNAAETGDAESAKITELPDAPDTEALPTASVTFEGCEYSITLDKTNYTLDDTITATVVLENKGDKTVGLYQVYLGNYLDEVTFCEWNNVRPSYSSDYGKGYPEAEQWRLFEPGDRISHTVSFTPGSPRDPGEDPAESYSDWSIWASLSYYTDTDAEEPDIEEVEPISVTVEVPHTDETGDGKDDELPSPDRIVVGIDGESLTLTAGSEYFELVMYYADKIIFNDVTAPSEFAGIPEPDFDELKQYGYAELVYDEPVAYFDDPATMEADSDAPLRRIMFLLWTQGPGMTVSADDDYECKRMYSVYYEAEMLEIVREMIGGEDTGETTTTPPAVTPEETALTVYEPVVDPPETAVTVHQVGVNPRPEVSSTSKNTASEVAVSPSEEETSTDPTQGTTTENLSTEPPAVTKPLPTLTTTQEPESEYPDPYISDRTLTSISMKLWGCDYTVSVDNPLYKVGDTITVTLTLTNNGDQRLDFIDDETHKNFLDGVKLYAIPHTCSAYSGEGASRRATLMPGQTWTYTARFDTSKLNPDYSWYLDARLTYYVNGKEMTSEAGFAVCHEGMSFGRVVNPFTLEEYSEFISGSCSGELYVIMEHETGPLWEEYLNEEYLGFEITGIEEHDKNESPGKYYDNGSMYLYHFSIHLKDTSNESMIAALYRIAELDKETNFVYRVYVYE